MAVVVHQQGRFVRFAMGTAVLAIATLALVLWLNEARRAVVDPLNRGLGAYGQGS